MKKQKRWESEDQIIARIDHLKRAQKRCLQLGDEFQKQSDVFRWKSLHESEDEKESQMYAKASVDWFHKSERKFLAADKRNATLKFMGEKLAAFRTRLLPIDGNTDMAVV